MHKKALNFNSLKAFKFNIKRVYAFANLAFTASQLITLKNALT